MANEKTVVADIDGKLVSWSDGYFSSPDRVLLNQVKENAKKGDMYRDDEYQDELVELGSAPYKVALTYGGEDVLAGNRTPLTAAAAMKLVNPGRTTFPHINNAEDLEAYFDELRTSYVEGYLKSTGVYDSGDETLITIEDAGEEEE